MISQDKPVTDLNNPITAKAQLPRRKRRRGWLITLTPFVLTVICLAGLAGTAFIDLIFNYGVAYGPQLDQVANVKASQLGATPVGVNILLQPENSPENSPDSPNIDKTLDMVKAGGFGFIRLELPWQQVENQKGVYNWNLFDAIVTKASARQIQVLFRLDHPPTWSRLGAMQSMSVSDKGQLTGPPDNLQDYFDFVGLVAQRYQGRVKYYQIWNEPNLPGEWNGQKADAVTYVKMLKGAYTAIKGADPTALVLAASLSPTDVLDPNQSALDDLVYLDQMYKAGAKDYFDILSIQLYALGYDPDFRFIQPHLGSQDLKRVNFNRPSSIHEVMIRNGDGNRPVWAAEYGWVSVPQTHLSAYQAPPTGPANQWGENISEAQQAAYLVSGIERVRQEWPWIGVVNVWFFRADDELAKNLDTPTNYWAIVNRDYQPRPAYTTLQNYLTGGTTQVSTIGWDPAANNPALQTTGAQMLQWKFQGERGELVAKAPLNLTVKVDGQNSRSVSAAAGQRVVLAEGLSDTTHTAEISGASASDIQGFYVSRDNHWAWLIALALAGFGAGLLASSSWAAITVGSGVSRWLVRVGPQLKTSLWQQPQKWLAPVGMIVALLLYYFAPPVPLALLGVMLFFPCCYLRPDWAIGLAALTAPLYLHPRNLSASGTLQFTLTEVIIVELIGVWIVGRAWQIVRTGFKFPTLSRANLLSWLKGNLVILPVLALFLLATLSLLTPQSYLLKEALRVYRENVFEPVALFGLALFYIGRKGSTGVVQIFDFLIIAGAGVGLVGIYQFFFPSRDASQLAVNVASQVGCTVSTEGVVRVCSVFSHPDSLGLYLGRIIPLAFGLAVFYRETIWSQSRRRQLYTLALVPMLITLGISYSRGAWLGIAAALLVVLIASRSRRLLMAFGGLAILSLAAIPFIKVERITSLFSLDSGSGVTRIYIWQSALSMIKDHPITGIGLDQFLYYYNPQYVNPLAWSERFTSHPHNMLLDFWLSLGILGPIVLIWLLVVFGRWAWRLSRDWQPARPTLRSAIAIGLLGSITDFAVHGMVDNSFFMIDLAVIFCLSFAFIEMLRRESVKEKNI